MKYRCPKCFAYSNFLHFLLNHERYQPKQTDATYEDRYYRKKPKRIGIFSFSIVKAGNLIVEEMEKLGLEGGDMRRLWLHQANTNMNRLIAQRVLGHEASDDESPTVLDTYGNTSSAGSIIAFHLHHDDMTTGDTGLICSFGAGYSAGTVFVRKT